MKNRVLIYGLLAALSISCGRTDIAGKLDEAESIISSHPDSALAIIRSIDTLSLNRVPLKARYSLLNTMAIDKNYIDTADVSVIMPAVEYYRKHGTADEKLKSYYYLGRIQTYKKDYNSAIVSYSVAEKEVPNSTDLIAQGLLYMAYADSYNEAKSRIKEKEYVEKGIEAFDKAGDKRHLNISSGRLAGAYYNLQKWSIADSLYREGIEKARDDTYAMSLYLPTYARMKVIQPDKDPQGAINLLKLYREEYKGRMSINDYGVLAYASCLIGDEETCSMIENQLRRLEGVNKQIAWHWLWYIEQHRGNYKEALEYSDSAHLYNSIEVEKLFSNSVVQSLQDFWSGEADRAARAAQVSRLRLFVIALSLSLFFLLLLLIMQRKYGQRKKEMERILKLGEESNRMLRQSNEALQLRQRQEYKETEEKLENLRKAFIVNYKEKFSSIGELCKAYIESQSKSDRKDAIIHKVEDLIAYISDDDRLHARFEEQINGDLDNVIRRLKADLGGVDQKESRFICYCIVGFDPEMIATILGLSLSNVYTKKSRLKERIRNLDSQYKDEYLDLLR